MGMADAKRIHRLYDQVEKNRKNCPYADLERLLLAVGFTVRKAKGSHRIFKKGATTIVVPEHNPVKENYVEMALGIVQECDTS
ncbi:MAG TPA: type II toxin-antitoxin system HicA family toxin [Candidatus Acidoferrales bacterium]|jgi:predicted RNA binding protein YcfA (HicA-like mRNA interferase family)|nr:type II toxin-antitoxin system HicA family toxin [Candidatus Acidoferrales bacterium]